MTTQQLIDYLDEASLALETYIEQHCVFIDASCDFGYITNTYFDNKENLYMEVYIENDYMPHMPKVTWYDIEEDEDYDDE